MIDPKSKGGATRMIGSQPLVPYADDGPEAKAVLAEIQTWQALVKEDDMQKKRGEFAGKLHIARYNDYLARQKAASNG